MAHDRNGFHGFSTQAFEFFRGLENHNSRDYWQGHKDTYDECVRTPLQALIDNLEPEFGSGKLFRPNRDVRFSRDKAPYKTFAAAACGTGDSVGYYLQVDADGLLVVGGFHGMSGEQRDRFRAAVDHERSGKELERIVKALTSDGFDVEGERLKTQPRGCPPDHPRIELMRHSSLGLVRRRRPSRALETRSALNLVRGDWRKLRPLVEWMDRHVSGEEPA